MIEIDEALSLEEDLALERAKSGLLGFTRATYGEGWHTSWHHRAICRAVNYRLAGRTPRALLKSFGIEGKELARQLRNPHPVTKLYAGMTNPDNIDKPIRNLQIAIAPRMGKSELLSRRLPAYLLGQNPDLKLISASYSTDLSRNLGRSVAKIIDEPDYARIFPDTKLGRSTPDEQGKVKLGLRNADMFEVVGRKGLYKNAGVGSALTGYGATYGIVDDALRNRQDADSPVIRKTLIEWFQSVFYTRLEQNSGLFLIGTRWHEQDLAGVTLGQALQDVEAEQYFCLIYPSVLDCDPSPGDPRTKHGEVLWPEKASVERMKRIRSSMSVYEFEALFQQRPAPPSGGSVKISWFNFYETLPPNLTGFLISADLTFKGTERGDYCCFQVWAEQGASKYMIDMVRERLTFTQQLQAFRALCAKYPQARVKLVEDAANGAALIDILKKEIPGVIGVRPVGSKEMRLDAVAPMIEAGNVFLPSTTRAKWVEIFLEEIRNFPFGSFDDTIDAASQALWRMMKKNTYTTASMPIAISGPSFADNEPSFGAGYDDDY